MAQVLTMTLPLREDEFGGFRIGETRIPLERVIYEFNQGETPEQIVRNFPSLNLADVYAVITYYLTNKNEVEQYVERRQKEADSIRADLEARYPSQELRQRLKARRPRKQPE